MPALFKEQFSMVIPARFQVDFYGLFWICIQIPFIDSVIHFWFRSNIPQRVTLRFNESQRFAYAPQNARHCLR